MIAVLQAPRPSDSPGFARCRGVSSPAVTAPVSIRLRPARLTDAQAILDIYNHEVLLTTATFDTEPRTLDVQERWIAERSGAFGIVVAVELPADAPAATPLDGEVVGFGALSPYKERAAYRTSVENSVYVRRDRHGQGIGQVLLTELLDIADRNGFHSVFARIEASGTASRALHERCGYRLVGIERETGRKFNRWLDVALMQCLLHERTLPAPKQVEELR
jgi:L-amino acid N-acyltransferase